MAPIGHAVRNSTSSLSAESSGVYCRRRSGGLRLSVRGSAADLSVPVIGAGVGVDFARR